jgi:hypothetical protein
MGDIGLKQQWLVSPTKEVEDMWLAVRLQEKRSMINRYRQDIEDLTKGRMVELTAKIRMLELEIRTLETQINSSQAVETSSIDAEIIQPKGGLSNG